MEKLTEEIVNATFRDSNKVVAVESHTEEEYLHKSRGAYISVTFEGGLRVEKYHPTEYATSRTVKEGAEDSRPVTVIDREYRQSDIVKILLEEQKETIRKRLACGECDGSGATSTPSSYGPCSDCDGTGLNSDGSLNDQLQ